MLPAIYAYAGRISSLDFVLVLARFSRLALYRNGTPPQPQYDVWYMPRLAALGWIRSKEGLAGSDWAPSCRVLEYLTRGLKIADRKREKEKKDA